MASEMKKEEGRVIAMMIRRRLLKAAAQVQSQFRS
jgi:hypothetical protein